MKNRIELERNEMSEILAQNFALNDEKFDASDFEWSAHCLQMAGFHKTEWISVEERLPEIEGDAGTWGELKIRKSVRVLCACVQKSGKTFVKEGYCEVWGDSQRAYWKIPGSIDKVTHWMPLPMPPKGDEGK